MGLYLCVFVDDEEVDGVEVGGYDDFGVFRDTVTTILEQGRYGSVFPTLMMHSDGDGDWSPKECHTLRIELERIAEEFHKRPAVPFHSEWQRNVANRINLKPASLYESFIDVDGESLLDRLQRLCVVAIENDAPILFQ
jgi:hypothetical protein